MYGLPYQTATSFLDTVEKICELLPEHISAYGLQLEEGTPLCKNQRMYALPSEDECVSMYSDAIALLKKRTYGRYEISNFAKSGYECRHNLSYWSGGEYLGFGVGAYSYFDSKRFHVESDIEAFCRADDISSLITLDEVLSEQDKVSEFVMLSLRLTDGFSEKELFDRTRNAEFYINRCEKYIRCGLMERKNGRIFFTEDGFNVSNSILSEILFD
jgi:oxygen-independent coproporphyrinogen-3 oxidase